MAPNLRGIMSTTEETQIADIEKELDKLWEAQKKENRTRSCLFNLIVYIQDRQRTEYFKNLVQSIISKFPCRILFIQGDSTPEQNYIRVNVSINVMGNGGNSFACDQILIETSNQQLHRVPFIILPHFMPDLPIYLLWGQNPAQDDVILPNIAHFATRLIFDAESTSDLLQRSKMILKLESLYPSLELLDVQWLLTLGWRQIISQVFDNPSALQCLATSEKLQVLYNHFPSQNTIHNDIQAVYFVNWLAHALKWHAVKIEEKEEGARLTFEYESDKCEIDIIPISLSNINEGNIVRFEAIQEENCFSIAPMDKLAKVVVHISCLDTCKLPFTLPLFTLKQEFPYIQEMFFLPISPQYTEMLQYIVKPRNGSSRLKAKE